MKPRENRNAPDAVHYAMPARASLDFRNLASSALLFSLGFIRIARCHCWHSTCGVFSYEHLNMDSRCQACCRGRGTSYAGRKESRNEETYDDTRQQENDMFDACTRLTDT